MKIILVSLGLCATLFGSNAEEIYDNYCLSCHSKTVMKFKDFKREKERFNAPPMNLVIQRLKKVIKISLGDEDAKQAVITAFIKDYVLSPSIDKGLCRVECFVQFGEMPKMQAPPTREELNAVANWVYERY